MKKSLSVLALVVFGIVAFGCISPNGANGVPPEPMTVSLNA